MDDVQTNDGTLAPRRQPIKIFISYSHKDAAEGIKLQATGEHLIQRALRAIQNCCQSCTPPIPIEQIFFDQDRLNQVEKWREDIKGALAECQMFIFLISPYSVANGFCRDEELAAAMNRSPQPLFVPVLLRSQSNWRIQLKNAGYPLGDRFKGGLPKNASNQPEALYDWEHPDKGFASLEGDLRKFMQAQWGQSPTQSYSAGRSPTEPLEPRLAEPYLCNQYEFDETCKQGFKRWIEQGKQQAQIVLIKGRYEDALEKLALRIPVYLLPATLGKSLGTAALTVSPFKFPGMDAIDTHWAGESLLGALLYTTVQEGLAGASTSPQTSAQLFHDYLKRQSRPVILQGFLPCNSALEVSTAVKRLGALQQAIDAYPCANGHWGKLLLIGLIQSEDASNHGHQLHVADSGNCLVIAPPPLRNITWHDITTWQSQMGRHEMHFRTQLQHIFDTACKVTTARPAGLFGQAMVWAKERLLSRPATPQEPAIPLRHFAKEVLELPDGKLTHSPLT